jgi:hypothetical protein
MPVFGQALRHEAEHLALALGERCEPVAAGRG